MFGISSVGLFVYMLAMSKVASVVDSVMGMFCRSVIRWTELFTLKAFGSGMFLCRVLVISFAIRTTKQSHSMGLKSNLMSLFYFDILHTLYMFRVFITHLQERLLQNWSGWNSLWVEGLVLRPVGRHNGLALFIALCNWTEP
jgi:hypothetical protein